MADSSGDELDLQDTSRERLDVGKLLDVQDFTGLCLGDDVSLKGDLCCRVATLQTGGSGHDWRAWGRWWAKAAASLDADIVALTEARFPSADAQLAACRGLLEDNSLPLHSGT